MADISLTTFVDFVSKSGTSRLTCVRNAKKQYQRSYKPEFDFWKPLRDAIVDMHRHGRSKDSLDEVLTKISDRKKVKLYPGRIQAYKRWVGRKRFEWLGCESSRWTQGSLTVRVNPELCMSVDDTNYLIKLYFKEERLSKNRMDAMLFLIQTACPLADTAGSTPAILDVPRGKLIEPTRSIPGLDALLAGEAEAFVQMWKRI